VGSPFFDVLWMRTDLAMSWKSAMRHHAQTRTKFIRFLVLLWGWGAAFGAAAAEPGPVRIGLTREASVAPLLVAIAAGYFQVERLDPEVTFLENDTSVSTAVASGKVDIGMAGLSAHFFSYAAAHSLKMIASRSNDQAGFPMYAILVGRKAQAAGFSDIRGLPHERIGIAGADSSMHYALFDMASRFGLDPNSIDTVSLTSPDDELQALSRGDIDAVFLPIGTAFRSANRGALLLRSSDFAQWQQGVVFTKVETIAKRRNLIERFMRAYQRGTAEYRFNFLEYDDAGDFIPGPHYNRYLDLIARQVGISPTMLAITKTYCDRRANLDVADITKQVKFWQDEGRLDNSIAAADLLDTSFIGEEIVVPQSRR
jgi:NitT/TauT family transport system substrate-binding protein